MKIFRNSSSKNRKLQEYVVKKYGKKLKPLFDIQIRWNSLLVMISRFLKIKECINHTLLELKETVLSEEEFAKIKMIHDVLEPFKIATKELSMESSNIITAGGCHKYLFTSLNMINNPLSIELVAQLKERMLQRRNVILITLLIEMSNGYGFDRTFLYV